MMKNKFLVIGLTGSIGMGKSTALKMFEALGLPVFCADKEVHNLLKNDETTRAKIIKLFPESKVGNRICRKRLGRLIFADESKREKLEKILHPKIWAARKSFLKEARAQKAKAALLDIPLLFETGAEAQCDLTICVSARAATQKERVLARKNMTPALFRGIIKRQMSDKEKRSRATFVIKSDNGKVAMRREIKELWLHIKGTY
jgi:dephospho-CoA kinase